MIEASRITPRELHEKLGTDEVVLVDVRRGSYAESEAKLPGAVRVDPESVEDGIEGLPRGSEIVTYCT